MDKHARIIVVDDESILVSVSEELTLMAKKPFRYQWR
jgi:hypothetical protein